MLVKSYFDLLNTISLPKLIGASLIYFDIANLQSHRAAQVTNQSILWDCQLWQKVVSIGPWNRRCMSLH